MKFPTRLTALCLLLRLSLPSFAKHVENLATVEAKKEVVPEYQLLDGQIEAVNKSTISAQTSGVISKLNYDVGDFVKKGSEIARISSHNQKAGLQEAQASVGQARASVSRAKAAVSQANASISQAAATVSQAQAALRETQASYTEARLEFGRVKQIFQKRLIAKSQYDKANSAGIVIDAIRLAKIALDRGIGGPLIPASAYLMKHPIEQMTDPQAKTACEKFVAGED